MRTVRADPNDPVGDGDLPPAYRVRIWGPPPAPRFASFVDEWDVTEAEQVTDVIEWAAKAADGNPFEVFIRWQDCHTSRDGRLVQRDRFALVYGKPADEESGTTEAILFEME